LSFRGQLLFEVLHMHLQRRDPPYPMTLY
jgi:hypothetical protein